jgi:hypothetical protein
MAIKELKVRIINGMGGAGENSIPVYGDNKAPRGGWAYMPDGVHQLMWENGKELLIVDPELMLPAENTGNKYFSFKDNGCIDYVRVWLIGEDGHGALSQPFWADFSHFEVVEDEPEPPPDEPVADWVAYDQKWEGGKYWLKKSE